MHAISTGEVALNRTSATRWSLVVNGMASSVVDLADPTLLDFAYMRVMAEVVDQHARPPGRMRALHLGGAGCAFARRLAATHPGSSQIAVEIDAALVELARAHLGLTRNRGVRLRQGDARAAVAATRAGSQDVIVRDVFSGFAVPTQVRTLEFFEQVRDALAPGGVYLGNVGVDPAVPDARSDVAGTLAVLPWLSMVHEPTALRRGGNVVVVAATAPLDLTSVEADLRGKGDIVVVTGPRAVSRWVAGAPAAHDRPITA